MLKLLMAWTTTTIVYMVAEGVVAVVSIVGNTLVLIVIRRYRILHTATNYFIGSLATADLMVGLVILPVGLLPRWGLPNEFYTCVMLNTSIILCTNVSLLSLLAITVDRYLAIGDPLRYHVLMNTDTAKMWIALVWLVAILLGSVPLFWHCNSEGFNGCEFDKVIDMRYMVYLIFFGINLPLLVVMILVYTYIYHVLRIKLLACMQIRVTMSCRKIQLEARRALGFFYVLVLHTVTWLPLHTLNCVILFENDLLEQLEYRLELTLALVVLSHLNSMLNPFVYACSNVRMKRAILQTLSGSDGMRTLNSQQSLFTQSDSSARYSRDSAIVEMIDTTFKFTADKGAPVLESTGSTSEEPIDIKQFLLESAATADDPLADKMREAEYEARLKSILLKKDPFKERRRTRVSFAGDKLPRVSSAEDESRQSMSLAEFLQSWQPPTYGHASQEKLTDAEGTKVGPENVLVGVQTNSQTQEVHNPARSANFGSEVDSNLRDKTETQTSNGGAISECFDRGSSVDPVPGSKTNVTV